MLKKANIIKATATVYALSLLIPAVAMAQAAGAPGGLIPSELKVQTDLLLIVQAIIRFILLIAFVLSFIFLLIGGIKWITSGGDDKGVASARNTITAALIGLVVVLLAYALIKLVETFFGVSILSGVVKIPTISTTP